MFSLREHARSLRAGGYAIVFALAGCGSSNGTRDEALVLPVANTRSNATGSAIAEHRAETTPVARSIGGETLCQASEVALFSCTIGTRRVSVCGSGSGAVYRYGMPGKVELTLRNLSFATRGYSGGGESQLMATNGDYRYTVFERTLRTSFADGGNEPTLSSGLVVARAGRTIASRMCDDHASMNVAAERTVKTGRFVEH